MQTLRVVLWNVQADQRTAERTRRIRARLAALRPDLLCLNEGIPSDVPDGMAGDHLLSSGLSDWKPEAAGARKVLLAARSEWEEPDTEGSPLLPEGRFVSGALRVDGRTLRVLGVAPPYHAYRTAARWAERRLRVWQGNEAYWQALALDVLPHVCAPAIILGDFNVQLPPRTYPRRDSATYRLCMAALEGWKVATANIPVDGPTLDKPLVCHVAHTPELRVEDLAVHSRFDADGLELSDHPCISLTIRV